MTKHTFPRSFLRKTNYHEISDISQVSHCYLVRYSDPNRPYNSEKEFKDKLKYHFGASQVLTGISTILLCRLKKRHLFHQIATPRRDSQEAVDIRRGLYFNECTGVPLCPVPEDLKYHQNVKFFGIKIKDVVEHTLDIVVKDPKKREVTIRTDVLRFGVSHTPKRSNFWHCDIILEGTDGVTNLPFDPTKLDREELDSTNKVTKKTVALIAMLEDKICLDNEIKRRPAHWSSFCSEPVCRKEKKKFMRGQS